MENRVVTSAPGKLMLFGEHAVVYGFPCLVTAVGRRMRVSLAFNGKQNIVVRAPQIGLDRYHKRLKDLGKQKVPKQVQFIEVLVRNFYRKFKVDRGLDIVTECRFSANFGFGSSAAVTVALAKSLSDIYSVDMDNRQLFDFCYKAVLDVQGVGSGFDIAAAVLGGSLYFVGGGKRIEQVDNGRLPLVVGYTGIKADTPTLVRQVAEQRKHSKNRIDTLFSEIGEVVEKARRAIEGKNAKMLGRLMDRNQELLHSLGVSSRELDRLIDASRKAGALGAKLSGAGGGDCMLAVVDEGNREAVEEAIGAAGGRVLEVDFVEPGVRREKA